MCGCEFGRSKEDILRKAVRTSGSRWAWMRLAPVSSSSTLLPAEFVETAAVDMIRSASPTLIGNEDLQKNKSTKKVPFIIVDILKPDQTSYAFHLLAT